MKKVKVNLKNKIKVLKDHLVLNVFKKFFKFEYKNSYLKASVNLPWKKIVITTELKQLSVEPLAVAKYFYNKGITSHLFIQKLIYFSFLEGLKENLLFFSENFQAWKHGPVLRTVFDEMTSCSDSTRMFAGVPALRKKEIINILEKIYQTYRDWEVWDVVDKSHEGPWQKTRAGLSEEEISTQEIELKELVSFANAWK